MDIDMFFARYNIDPTAAVDEADVSKLVQDLLGKPEEGNIDQTYVCTYFNQIGFLYFQAWLDHKVVPTIPLMEFRLLQLKIL